MWRLAEVGGWWTVLTAGWAATLSAPVPADLLLGSGCALACAVVAVAVRRAIGGSWRPNPGWLVWLGPLAVAVPGDTARLLAWVVHRSLPDPSRDGRLRKALPPANETPQRAAFRRAWGTLLLSAAPGSVVVDWPPDGSPAQVHLMGSARPAIQAAVFR